MKRSQEQLRPPQSQRKDAEAPVKIIIKCLEAWSLERTVLVADGEPAIHALMIAAKLARHRRNGRDRHDSKSKGLVENADQVVQGLTRTSTRTWVASIEKRYHTTLSPSSPLVQRCVRHLAGVSRDTPSWKMG